MNFTAKLTVVSILFCFLKAGISTGNENCQRLEKFDNSGYFEENTVDVGKCGSHQESTNRSNAPSRTCIPLGITEERHLLLTGFYVRSTKTIQTCQEVTSACQRLPRMITFYPQTKFKRTINVGVCAGSCGDQVTCKPVWTKEKAIATPNGERLISIIKNCSCVRPSCYRVVKYEAFAELYTDDKGNNVTRTKLVDMGHCVSKSACRLSLRQHHNISPDNLKKTQGHNTYFRERGLPASCYSQFKHISILSTAGRYITVSPKTWCSCQ